MTVTTEFTSQTYLGDGVNKTFPYAFKIPSAQVAHLYLLPDLIEIPSSNYSLTGLNNPLGGTLTYPKTGAALAAGAEIKLAREMPYKQELDIRNQTGFLPEVVEDALDALAMQIQQLHGGDFGDHAAIVELETDVALLEDEVLTLREDVDALTAGTVPDGSVTTVKLGDGAVTGPKLAAGSVDGSKIVDLSVGTAELANQAVTSAKIEDGAVGIAKMGAAIQLDTGKYTPGVVHNANVGSSSPDQAHWQRIGPHVMVWGLITINPTTANVATQISFDLPIASTFVATRECVGTAVGGTVAGRIAAGTNRAQLFFTPTSGASTIWHYHYTYEVK